MARLVGVDLPRNKRLEIALTYIYGIGPARSKKILEKTGISPDDPCPSGEVNRVVKGVTIYPYTAK